MVTTAGFKPATITVQLGRPVTFANVDTTAHRVVSDESGLFDTGEIAPGATASVNVTVEGFHDFHDAGDPRLTGTIRILR
jgi:plastocyanin